MAVIFLVNGELGGGGGNHSGLLRYLSGIAIFWEGVTYLLQSVGVESFQEKLAIFFFGE